MSDQENQGQEMPNELELLKQKADIMGIKYHPNIGVDTLRAKVQAKLDGEESQVSDELKKSEMETIEEAAKYDGVPKWNNPTPEQIATIKRKEANKLVRIRLANMNPVNNNVPAIIISVGNSQIGMIKKAIPFNVAWHVPQVIVNYLKTKKYVAHYEVPDPRRPGKKIKRTRLVPEFAVEILPDLTAQELKELKQRQLMQQGAQEQ